MDSIERNNKYREKCRITPSPVIVKKQKKDKVTIQYVVVGCSKEIIKEMLDKKLLHSSILLTLQTHNLNYTEEQIESVVFCGDLSKFTQYDKLVYKFPMRKRDILEKKSEQFRLYTHTLDYQKNLMYNINLCTSASASWKSVITKVGSNYGIILKIKTTE